MDNASSLERQASSHEEKSTEDVEPSPLPKAQEASAGDPQTETAPHISVELALDPPIHSYSSDAAPRLRLTLTSHADRPITIYDDGAVASPGRLLAQGSLAVRDVARGVDVPRRKARFCDFEPPRRVAVPLREALFHTLYPETPAAFEAAFGRKSGAPEPLGDADAAGRLAGVEGLEPGRHYRLRSDGGWGWIRWWEYGEKEAVIDPPGGKLDGRTVAYRHHKNPHPGIRLDTKSIPVVDFWCTE